MLLGNIAVTAVNLNNGKQAINCWYAQVGTAYTCHMERSILTSPVMVSPWKLWTVCRDWNECRVILYTQSCVPTERLCLVLECLQLHEFGVIDSLHELTWQHHHRKPHIICDCEYALDKKMYFVKKPSWERGVMGYVN